MDALKKFIGKKKADVKFKSAGPGHKLTDSAHSNKAKSSAGSSGGSPGNRAGDSRDAGHGHAPKPQSGPSEEKRQAAAAALARLEKQRKPDDEKELRAARQLAFIKEQARREIEAELKLKEEEEKNPGRESKSSSQLDSSQGPSKPVDPALYAVSGIFYTCSLIGPEVGSKEEIEDRIKNFLLNEPEEELATTSCLMVYSCNKPREKVNVCVDILCKYLDNIINNPDNPKVRKIRFANKAYQDKVACVEGSSQFLRAAGFQHNRINNEETNELEDVWVFVTTETMEDAIDRLIELRDTLKETNPIRPELDRNLQILMPAQVKQRKELPPEFYQLSGSEIKREQQLKTDHVERELTLRTKAQREKDELREQRTYRYCIMRVRFPDGLTLQGTFMAYEKLSALFEFVRENLLVEDLEFALKIPRSEDLQDSDETTLSDSRLPPASIVNFFVENVPEEISSGAISYLKPEILNLVKAIE